jgi:predicted DNA-binding transcriptional regulator AlpA
LPYIGNIIAYFFDRPGDRPMHYLRSLAVELKLAGLAEVAEVLEVSKRTAVRYTARADFPEPVARLRSGPVWLEDDVRRWAEGEPVPRGRPPKYPRRPNRDLK